MPAARPLPPVLPPTSARREPSRQVAFRPRGFSPPRRFPPRPRSRACCIPVPEGVRRVSDVRALLATTHRPRGDETRCLQTPARFPATRFTPFEEVPPPAAHRIAAARPASLRPLPPRRCRSTAGLYETTKPSRASTSGLSSAVGSVAAAACCHASTALSFHGLCSPPGFWPGVDRPTHRVSAPARSTHSRRTVPTLPSCRSACPAAATRRRLSPTTARSDPPAGSRHPVARSACRFGVMSWQSVCSLDPGSNRRSDSMPARDRGPSWGL